MSMEKIRIEFEAWALTHFINSDSMHPLVRDEEEPEEYRYSRVNMAWVAWQASRAAQVIELPTPYVVIGDYAACGGSRVVFDVDYAEKITDRMCEKTAVYDRATIEAAGLKVNP